MKKSRLVRKDILESKEQILQWIQENKSKAFICRQLKCKFDTLEKYLNLMNIEYNGNRGGTTTIKKTPNTYIDLDTYLKTSKNIQTTKIRKKLLKEGIKPHQCESCKLTKWKDKPIPLELHHKDGNKHHNELSNFELLCPNCHTFTDTYRGKNKK